MLPRKLLFCLFSLYLVVCTQLSFAQSNPCGVTAVMIPAATDTVVIGYNVINFQSASVNATSFRFIIGPYEMPMNLAINWAPEVGLTTVKLVAYNGGCTDTTEAYYFRAGTFPLPTDNSRSLYGYAARGNNINDISSYNGGYLLSGYREYWYEQREGKQGLLIKTKPEGCVAWGRKLVADFPTGTDIKIAEPGAADAVFVLGSISFLDHIIKLDSQGDLLWAKSFQDVTGYPVPFYNIYPTPDGGVIASGAASLVTMPLLIRFNSDGSIRWQRKYDYNFANASGFKRICLKDNMVYAGGTIGYNNDAMLTKVDDATGVTIWTRRYSSINGPLNVNNLLSIDSTLLFGYSTPTGILNTPPIGGFFRIDTSGNVLLSKLVGETYVPNTLSGPYGGNSELTRSGKNFYIVSAGGVSLSLQPGVSFYTKLIRIDSNYNVVWVKSSGGSGVPRFFYGAAAPNDGIALGGIEQGSAVSPTSLAILLSLKKIDSSGGNPNANCYFANQPPIVVQPSITMQNTNWYNDVSAGLTATNSNVPIEPFYPEMRFKCPDYVDSCSYLKLSGPKSICNLNYNYTIKSHKNKSCGQPTQWRVPVSAQIVYQTDTSVTVRLPSFGRYVIYGTNPLSCVPVQDSLVIMAAGIASPPNLGSDREICPQNSFVLHAGPSYFSYEWQDGSIDSLFTVRQPGQYWVRVTDSCSNVFSDTIQINPSAPISVSIGQDLRICPGDTAFLQASPGFINYRWSPAYNISSQSSATVQVYPLTNTMYTLIAEKTPGCFAYDSIGIEILQVPVIDIGPDRSFCQGDSAVLDAGNAFTSYLWSNGATLSQLTVYNVGNFSVIGTTTDGCTSKDTMKVIRVFALPTPNLDKDSILCVGETKTLDAGAGYTSYQWNTGSTSRTINVSGIGTYRVLVTDTNGCKGESETVINRIKSLPSSFLGADTSICSYGSIVLKPLNNFSDYLWNTGNTQKSITITNAGQYWLQVKDLDNCLGRDTIVVLPKQCLKGLFVPSGFTPNGDGLNDQFKASLFGDIRYFKFSVFNRWGTIVFQSSHPNKGWDGRYGGILQENSVFVWVCNYQLNGEPARSEKGTFTLIR